MMSRKKYIAALLFSLTTPFLSFADGDTAAMADSLFARKEYSKALPLYMQLQNEQASLTVDQLFRMAVSMTEGSNNQQQAINLLSKLTEFPFAPSDTWYYLGEANRKLYKFEDAIDYFNIYLNRAKDDSELLTQAELQINSCENGMQMLDYATRINRIAKKQVPVVSFYDIYDTFSGMDVAKKPQAMWMSADSLVDDKHPLSDIIFYPKENSGRDANIIYFSSYGQDKETGLDIFCIKRIEGNSWGEPEEITAANSPFDEILPYITPDGNTLYFASNGHYGMGGFDIYKTEYNSTTRTWSIPENLGFPISSPYDDFLFVPNAANKTACFASLRDTNNDEVTVYKVEMTVNPERISVSNVNEIMAMASFNVDFSSSSSANAIQKVDVPIKELAGNESYVLLVRGASTLSKQLSDQLSSLDKLRQQLSYTSADEKEELEQKIINGELEIEFTRATFGQVQALLGDAEYQFYTNGVQPSISEDFKVTLKNSLSETTKHEASTPQADDFGQTVLSLQSVSTLTMKPPKLSDANKYRFRTTGKSIILLNDPVPKDGIVYKIRIGIFSKELTETQLKNLSPVTTEKRGTTTRYYIGLFRTYNDALKALGEVKKKGFKDAVIDAWVNGKAGQTSRARTQEKQATQRTTTTNTRTKPGSKSTVVYRVNVSVFGDTSGSNVPSLLNTLSGGRDIARKVNPDGSTTYSVGIFTKQAEADEIKHKLEEQGVTNIEVVSIEVKN